MDQLQRSDFPHRRNQDGSFDSICTVCFNTVGTADLEEKLQLLESAHVCHGCQLGLVVHFEDKSPLIAP